MLMVELKRRSSLRSLVYRRDTPADVSLSTVGSKYHLRWWWLLGKKSDLVWQRRDKCQKRHPRRCREDTLQRENPKQQHKNKKLSKFHSGTNVTAQSGAAEAPDNEPTTLHLWTRPQMAVMSIQNGSVGFCHAIHKWLSTADPGRRSRASHVSQNKSPSRQDNNEMSHKTALVQWVFQCF